MEDEYTPNKDDFKDEKGRYIVQGLFLEDNYNTDLAVYTLAGYDKEYKGRVFPSLKRLYLEAGDPNEYAFAQKYLFDWPHWQRICKNKVMAPYIQQWRDELALALVSDGLETIIDLALNQSHYQAAKFLADKGWIDSERGRPSKEEVEGELKRRADADSDVDADYNLLTLYQGGKDG